MRTQICSTSCHKHTVCFHEIKLMKMVYFSKQNMKIPQSFKSNNFIKGISFWHNDTCGKQMTAAKMSPLFCRFTLSTQWKLHCIICNLFSQHVFVYWLRCWRLRLVILFKNCTQSPPDDIRLQLHIRRDTGCTLQLLQVLEQRFSSLRWAERKSSQQLSGSVDHLTWLSVIRTSKLKISCHSAKLWIRA